MSIELAQQTLQILNQGTYVGPDGRDVVLREQIQAAREGTVLYRPDTLRALVLDLLKQGLAREANVPARLPLIEVTTETTVQAARRLLRQEGLSRVLALNFASARNPGGGFLRGTQTQEESLAYSSALYPCLLPQVEYYDANRACGSPFYTNHMLYSPDVPFFRDETFRLLKEPFPLSILTAPAPNVRIAREAEPDEEVSIHLQAQGILASRILKLLSIAVAHEHRNLVLGPWGCGVFGNDPRMVAEAFWGALNSSASGGIFEGCFDHVTFAVWDRDPENSENVRAFRQRFT